MEEYYTDWWNRFLMACLIMLLWIQYVHRCWNCVCKIQFEHLFMSFCFLFRSSCVWRTSGRSSRCATTSSACATVSCLTLSTSLMSGTSARWVKHQTYDGCCTLQPFKTLCSWTDTAQSDAAQRLHSNYSTVCAQRHDAACVPDNIVYCRSDVLLLSDEKLRCGVWYFLQLDVLNILCACVWWKSTGICVSSSTV